MRYILDRVQMERERLKIRAIVCDLRFGLVNDPGIILGHLRLNSGWGPLCAL
jgi:hypothetical protein